MKRALTPSLNPTGLGSAAAAIYAAAVMITNAVHHHGVIDPQVIIAALSAAAFLYARFKVTPVADPKDGNGTPLKALPPAPQITVNSAGMTAAEVGRLVNEAVRKGSRLASGGTVQASANPQPSAPSEPPAGPAA